MTVDARPPGDKAQSTAAAKGSWLKGAGWLGLAVFALSASNYLFSLSMTRLLPPSAFVEYVGVQSLLLVIGTGVMAAVPWVMAREVARARAAPAAERDRILGETLGFGLLTAAAQGVLVAVVAGLVGYHVGGVDLAAAAAVAAFAISMVAAPVGLLQGLQRFSTVACLRVVEGVIRIGSSLVLVVLVTTTASAAIVGMAVGSGVLIGTGLVIGARGLRPTRPHGRQLAHLLKHAVRLGSAQILLTLLASIDAVVAALTTLSEQSLYAYQTAALLGRAPLFVALALAQALYPVLVAASTAARARIELRRAVGVYLRVALLVLVGALTVPESLLQVLVGGAAPLMADLLRPTAVSGVLVGLAVLLSTVLQAQERPRRLLPVLVVACVAQPALLLVASRYGALAFATTGAVVIAGTTLVLWWSVRENRPFGGRRARFWVPFLVAVPVTLALAALHTHPGVWCALMLTATVLIVREIRSRS